MMPFRFYFLVLFLLSLIISCGNKNDSVQSAKVENNDSDSTALTTQKNIDPDTDKTFIVENSYNQNEYSALINMGYYFLFEGNYKTGEILGQTMQVFNLEKKENCVVANSELENKKCVIYDLQYSDANKNAYSDFILAEPSNSNKYLAKYTTPEGDFYYDNMGGFSSFTDRSVYTEPIAEDLFSALVIARDTMHATYKNFRSADNKEYNYYSMSGKNYNYYITKKGTLTPVLTFFTPLHIDSGMAQKLNKYEIEHKLKTIEESTERTPDLFLIKTTKLFGERILKTDTIVYTWNADLTRYLEK